MKRLLFSFLFVLTAIAGWAQEPTEFTDGHFSYVETDAEHHYVSVAQNDGNKPSGAITISSSVTHDAVTYTVTSIADYGFGSNEDITEVTIPNTVTSIGEGAFYGCDGLTTITLPSTLTTIGNSAFWNCSSLSSFSVPGSVTTIGAQVFDYCSIPTFTFEASNTAVTCNAVIPCTNNLYLYRDVDREGYQLTTGAIKALTIGANVTTIYDNMFLGCTYLSSIDFSEATGLTSIGEYAFYNCGNYVPTEPGEDPVPNLTTIDLSNTKVTSIGEGAFRDCSKLTTITLPSTLTTIGIYAFWNCSSLTSFSVPGSVTTIGAQVFDYCSIPTFTFEASNTAVTCNAVIPCTNNLYLYRDVDRGGYELTTGAIKALTIGANVTTINEKMFQNCTYLSSLDFSAATGLTSIGDNAFYGCGNYVPEPGEDPVPNLTAIDLSNTKVKSIGQSAFNSCSKLETITLPSTLTSIGDYAFQDCRSLVSFSLPGSVTTISSNAFFNCSIPTFTFEASNTTLTWNTTVPCSGHLYLYRNIDLVDGYMPNGLQAVTIGENVTGIGTMFYEATQLENVYVPWLSSPITIADGAFCETTYTNATLWIPGGTGDIYDAADGWKNFEHVAHWSTLVTLTASNHGSIVTEEATASNGTEQYRQPKNDAIVYTLNADTGYELTALTDNAAAVSPLPALGEAQTRTNPSGEEFVTLNATFSAISYTLGYELAGGTVASANPTSYTIESAAITLNNPTREGYTFTGWTGTGLDAATTTVTIAAGSTGNRSYTATWTPIIYNIEYTMDDGTATPANPTTYTIETPTFTLTNPTKTGYTFKGWKLNGVGEAQMTVTITTGSTGDVAYTATWQVNQYTITFNSNGGSDVDAITQDYGTTVTPPAAPTKTGYNFAGWTPALPATMPAENMTVVAQWTLATYTVTITGGGVTADNTTPKYGENVVLTIMNDPDATLTSLKVNGTEVKESIADNQYTIENVSGDINVVATWSSTKEFITLGSDIATFSCTQDLNFTGSELKAYIAAGFSKDGGGTVLLVRVYDVPANTGLVIKGTQGDTYKIPYNTSTSYFVNMLKAHTTAEAVPVTEGDYTNFILQKPGDDYVWNHGKEGTMSLGAKKAYLQLPTSFVSSSAREMYMVFEDELTPTEIRDNYILLQESKYNGRIYNLNGQQIDTMQKGVNIVNGRKILK